MKVLVEVWRERTVAFDDAGSGRDDVAILRPLRKILEIEADSVRCYKGIHHVDSFQI